MWTTQNRALQKNLCTKIKNKVIITTIMIISSVAISFQVQRTINSTLKLLGTLPSKFFCHDEQIFHSGMEKTVYCIFNSDNLHYKSVKKWALLFLFSLRIFLFLKTLNLKKKICTLKLYLLYSWWFHEMKLFSVQILSLNFFLLIYLGDGFKLVFSIVLQNLEIILGY